ncbi:MAG: 3',5'-cyclic-nucleotide phosphodiesterase [Methylophilaceae bacterium]|nr:3',5'-cyclic-nucleotide phosphodiesterase [Methylophilaceae bacterium]
MRIKVLGCSGGIGGTLRTTSFLVDDDILLDAGTGVGDLSIEQLLKIDHIFITHSHLDHITSIPFLADTVLGFREAPIYVYATVETWKILKDHLFNWKIWPDFTVIPSEENPLLIWKEVRVGETVALGQRQFTPVPANHVVPAVGYHLEGPNASMVFTGDTTTCDALWPHVNRIGNLKYLIIETAFSTAEIELAKLSKHLCPSLLIEELSKLKHSPLPRIYITHLKPGEGEVIMREIDSDAYAFNARPLYNGHIFEL